MIKILHLSDIHLGSSFPHGRINPETGLNTRLEDFVKTLEHCIDRAIEEADLVLFGGDAFPDATPPPYVQQAFAKQFQRLAAFNIPTILLVGNHDLHSQGTGGASLSIYRTLAVPGFIVGDTIETHRIQTKNGDIQVITLPWLTRSTLLTRPETEGLSMADVNIMLIDRLNPVLEGEIRKLDPELPTVLLAHLMADRANLGAERFLAVGKGFTLPMSLLIREEFDYVALGHVHKHQNLNPENNPPVIYPGSIERVDFSEEKEEKGYVLVDIKKGKVNWEFCSIPARRFCTINVDISQTENPEETILQAIAQKEIQDAVVRLIYKLRSDQIEQIDSATLQKALEEAHTYTIVPELTSQLSRPRLPELGANNSLDPLDALKTYLGNREDLKALSSEMLDAAERLLNGEEIGFNVEDINNVEKKVSQLSLLS
ncbi:exonuclease subunit SbcD [Spirulina sp. 06S082]|uniref:exonuclease subunit SbcD n=1 Tax=Spirulina sp. 06S082 TaxID=3110248 RepID=UPI002B209E91|nr:exonuclease subunit SbcD [Spirulina sp. 06S082]MEA5470543.1 exonuclease subunit SbcD [Spirulina sp. 06S082]